MQVHKQNKGNLSVHFSGFEQSGNVQLKLINLMGQTVFQENRNNPTRLTIYSVALI